jgi:hypothetical protein
MKGTEMETDNEFDPERVSQVHDLAEAIEDVIPENAEFGIVVHALVHVLARGGVQVSDRMTKREFVAGVVDALDANYRNIELSQGKE